MQIHKITDRKNKGRQKWWWLAVAIVGLLLFVVVSGSEDKEGVLCDFESRTLDKLRFTANGQSLSNGKTQSDHKSRSGKYSSKLDDKQLYGPTYSFDHVYSGDVYEASVWMNNDNGFGTLAFSGSWGFYADQKEVSKTENGWHLLKRQVTIPIGVYDEKLSIFPFTNKQSKAVYFDDMSMKKISSGNPATIPPVSADPNRRLDIIVEDKSLDKLKQKRIEAYKHGSLISSKKDLVPAKIKVGGKEIDAEIRLKGDLLDHLYGRMWSFRIHTKNGSAWNGMKVFSVHNSKSRDHLSEWVFHKMLEDEDVLTTKYDYVEVALNGESLGIYAYEEHFLKQLLQWQNRPEGPILKISEDAHWEYAGRKFGSNVAYYESAQIEPFDKDAMKKSNAYAAEFEKGQELLYGFMHGDLTVLDVFDVGKLAKYLAIQDVCNAWHSFNYTNLRFYFNSITGKLEPVGFDGFTPDGLFYNKALYITGSQVNSRTNERITPHKFVQKFHKKIFTNLDFAALYDRNLERLSSPKYIDAFKQKHEAALQDRIAFLRQGYKNYKFSWDTFFDNAKDINEVMAPAKDIALKAYRDGRELVLRSYHLLPLEVLGFGGATMTSKIPTPTILESYDKTKPILEKRVPFPSSAKRVFVRTLGTTREASFPIFKWNAPSNEQAMSNRLVENAASVSIVKSSSEAFIIPSGKYVLSTPLVVSSKPLIIQPGAEIDLQNGASIIVSTSIQAVGSVETPIVIRSSKVNGQGVVLMSAKDKSMFQSCTFDNLQKTNRYSVLASGGLSVYESEVVFERCVFSQAKSRDALRIDRSEFEMRDCIITNASADGIDANFSTGIIDNLIMEDIGKDGVEVSGGFCRISNSKITGVSGTAINANQHGNIEAMNVEITNCDEGVKSVDLSSVTLSASKMINVKTGILAFRKNDEMGGGTIKIFDLIEENVGKRNVQDQHSSVFLNKQKLETQ